MGAEIETVERGGPADRAGLRAGDVITEVNGKPVRDNNELVSMIMATRPETTVPLRVVRNKETITLNVTVAELDLAAEQQRASSSQAEPRRGQPRDTGFGMSITPVTPQIRQELGLPAGQGGAAVVAVTPFGPAAQAGLQPQDVILSIQGQRVTTADEVSAAIDAIPAGRTTRMIVWRDGNELAVQVRKR
jgi:serine protease Do